MRLPFSAPSNRLSVITSVTSVLPKTEVISSFSFILIQDQLCNSWFLHFPPYTFFTRLWGHHTLLVFLLHHRSFLLALLDSLCSSSDHGGPGLGSQPSCLLCAPSPPMCVYVSFKYEILTNFCLQPRPLSWAPDFHRPACIAGSSHLPSLKLTPVSTKTCSLHI